MSILVVDIGTSGVRSTIVRPDATIAVEHRIEVLPDTPAPGLVEFDATKMATAALATAQAALAEAGTVAGIGIANQRASTIVWDRKTGVPVAPGLGWQDLRTLGDCLVLQAEGLRFAPNQSATKMKHLLDLADPDRQRDLCVGTVDSWIIWILTEGAAHVTDPSNAGVTGLLSLETLDWDDALLETMAIPRSVLPTIVDSTGPIASATALKGAPMICGTAGDQQASLIGQGCVRPGMAKITFGTGGMLDVIVGPTTPTSSMRNASGTFPIIAWRRGVETMWANEAIMLSAGSNIEWLRDDLGIIDTSAESHELAQQCDDTDGVVYVPALLGLGTPQWDYGARGTLLGITRGTSRPHIVRAVLEGVAQRGADLVEATEADTGLSLETLRVDGGMSANPTFTQVLANATQRSVEISPVLEATTLGAAFLAGLSSGTWSSWDDIASTWIPSRVVEPAGDSQRDRWSSALERAGGWYPELSSFDF
ncbi:MAG: FGGY family carbohydrate kinase [Acidimicrobiales bacterium]